MLFTKEVHNIFSGSFLVLTGFLFCILSASSAPAALDAPDKVDVEELHSRSVEVGDTTEISLSVTIDSGWHINTNDPEVDGLIPTKVRVNNVDTVSLVSVTYPPDKKYSFSFSDRDLRVYSGTVEFLVTLKVSEQTAPGIHRIPLRIDYQACSDRKCLPPHSASQTLKLSVQQKQAQSERNGFLAGLFGGGFSGNGLESNFQNHGWGLGLIAVFLLGLSLNLTPCVYPMIPITVGYFGGRNGNQLGRRFLDGALYVLGMATIYSLLGALAGVTGAMLGTVLQSPIVLAILSMLMVVLSGGMFGFYPLQVPAGVRKGGRNVADMLGTFGMGMTLGVAAAPCMAPATVALLTYVGKIGDFLVGAGIFFVMSLGLGAPYLFLAVFSSSISDLPGAGDWMEWVKKALGFVILGVAIYFIWPLLPTNLFPYLVVTWMVTSAIVLAIAHPPERDLNFVIRCLVVVGVLFSGLYWTKHSLLQAGDSKFKWMKGSEVITEGDQNINGPALVYVSADWCVPCKEMEIQTFPNKRLQRKLSKIKTIKIDLSQQPPKAVDNWMMENEVMGVPTMIFLDHRGEEVQTLRVQGFIGASDLIERVQSLLDNSTQNASYSV